MYVLFSLLLFLFDLTFEAELRQSLLTVLFFAIYFQMSFYLGGDVIDCLDAMFELGWFCCGVFSKILYSVDG